eukprot:scaffold71520_cov50-Attheya_sp.AAC.2
MTKNTPKEATMQNMPPTRLGRRNGNRERRGAKGCRMDAFGYCFMGSARAPPSAGLMRNP